MDDDTATALFWIVVICIAAGVIWGVITWQNSQATEPVTLAFSGGIENALNYLGYFIPWAV